MLKGLKKIKFAGSSNGRTTGFGPVSLGSSPSPAAVLCYHKNMEEKEEKTLVESITTLTELIRQIRSEKYLQMVDNRKKFLFYNFIAGLARGVGWALGATVVLGFVVWILSHLINVPLLGDWIGSIIDYIQEAR